MVEERYCAVCGEHVATITPGVRVEWTASAGVSRSDYRCKVHDGFPRPDRDLIAECRRRGLLRDEGGR
jgi:hypothetical protein